MITIERFQFPDDRAYDPAEHLWLMPDAGVVTVGMDALAREALGEIVHLSVAEPGTVVARGEAMGSVEAEKMVSTLTAPVTGRVVERNDAAIASPSLLRDDPYGAGWLVSVEPERLAEELASCAAGTEAIRRWAEREVERYVAQGWVE